MKISPKLLVLALFTLLITSSFFLPSKVFAASYYLGCSTGEVIQHATTPPNSSNYTSIAYKCSDGSTIRTVNPAANNGQTFAVSAACRSGGTGDPGGQPTAGVAFGVFIINCGARYVALNPGSENQDPGGSTLEEVDQTLRCDNGQEGVPLSEGQCLPFNEDDDSLSNNPILKYVGTWVKFLTALVGVVIVIVIVIAGLRYIFARGNQQEVAAAKGMIQSAIIGLVMYIFSAALIYWIGGFNV